MTKSKKRYTVRRDGDTVELHITDPELLALMDHGISWLEPEDRQPVRRRFYVIGRDEGYVYEEFPAGNCDDPQVGADLCHRGNMLWSTPANLPALIRREMRKWIRDLERAIY